MTCVTCDHPDVYVLREVLEANPNATKEELVALGQTLPCPEHGAKVSA